MQPARSVPPFEELYERIRALPPGTTGEILQPGVVRTMSRPGRPHTRALQQIFRGLGGADLDAGGRGWWFQLEPEIRFPLERLAVPDLAGWRAERVPCLPNENPLTVLPDWACEVLSPTTSRDDRRLKLPLYASSGVEFVWICDPETKLLEVFETRHGIPARVAAASEETDVTLPPFDCAFDVSRFWWEDAGTARP